MGKSFFEFIAGLINGSNDSKQVSPAKEEVADGNVGCGADAQPAVVPAAGNRNSALGGNSIDSQEKVQVAVLRYLKGNFGGQRFRFEDRLLILWTQGGEVTVLLDNDSFRNELARRLYDEQRIKFREIRVTPLQGNLGSDAQELLPGVYVTIGSYTTPGAIVKARLETIPGYGSTLEPFYQLEPGKSYNIGVGSMALLDNGALRRNDIAVDDNVRSQEYERNKYVSRNHAHIEYVNEHFVLYVDKGGLRSAGKRTAVARGENTFPLEDTLIPFPLEDGDMIVLSRAVRILFTKCD